MKKYTIVFAENQMIGHATNSITRYDRVETNCLGKLLSDKYDGSAWFIFEGWPKVEGEGLNDRKIIYKEADQDENKRDENRNITAGLIKHFGQDSEFYREQREKSQNVKEDWV